MFCITSLLCIALCYILHHYPVFHCDLYYNIILYCTMLCITTLSCIALCSAVQHYFVLYRVLHYNIILYFTMFCITLFSISLCSASPHYSVFHYVLHYIILHFTVFCSTTLFCIALCLSLQHYSVCTIFTITTLLLPLLHYVLHCNIILYCTVLCIDMNCSCIILCSALQNCSVLHYQHAVELISARSKQQRPESSVGIVLMFCSRTLFRIVSYCIVLCSALQHHSVLHTVLH